MNTVQPIRELSKIGEIEFVKGKTHIVIKEKKTDKLRRFKINNALQYETAQYIRGMKDTGFLFSSRTGHRTKLISRVDIK